MPHRPWPMRSFAAEGPTTPRKVAHHVGAAPGHIPNGVVKSTIGVDAVRASASPACSNHGDVGHVLFGAGADGFGHFAGVYGCGRLGVLHQQIKSLSLATNINPVTIRD